MKKSILLLTLVTAAFFSCKKKTTATDFTATDVTGTTTVQGVCTKNIVTPNGSGGWTTANKVPATNVLVQMKVNKNQLYPNSIAQGADVYSATTGTNGAWSMSVKSTANGVNGYMTIAGFNATQDTLINGNVKAGLWANYFGTSMNVTLFMGTTYDAGTYNFAASNLNTNPNNIMIGTALVSGTVGLQHWLKTVVTGTAASTSFGSTVTPIQAGTTVYMSFDMDPTLMAPKMYTATTNSSGGYTISVNTVAMGTSGFNQDATIWVADHAGTKDSIQTINGGAGTVIFSKPGVHGNASTAANALYNNEIRNNAHITLTTFTAN